MPPTTTTLPPIARLAPHRFVPLVSPSNTSPRRSPRPRALRGVAALVGTVALLATATAAWGQTSTAPYGPANFRAYDPPPECEVPFVAGRTGSPGFMRSLSRYSPLAPVAPATVSAHAPEWDQTPTPAQLHGAVVAQATQHDCRTANAPFSTRDFSPDPLVDCYCWDGCDELNVYGGKHCNPTQFPWVQCGWPFYGPGLFPPSETWLGETNLVRRRFYVYGDFRTAVASNTNINNAETVWANRLNLDLDYAITATERFHMFWGPLDQGQQFTGFNVNSGQLGVEQHADLWDKNTDTLYFEGDVGALLGGFDGTYSPFDLPFAVGLIPLVLQNGIWLEDAFVGAAATIPARNAPTLDWANFDTTFFVGFDELTTRAFNGNDNARFVGATTFIERRGGYIELAWAYVDDPSNQKLDYHNFGLSYTRRYLNLVSNSARLIVNTGQGGPRNQRTADGCLVLLENSLLTPLPYNLIPYFNLFAGFDSPQPLGRLQGPLKNTGINFESDLLTGYPILDDTGNNTYGGALGVDLLGCQFDRQLIVETAFLQTMGDAADHVAPGDEYAVGVRYQKKLNYCLLIRADAMHGWIENARDVSGARVELRHKF